MTTERAKEFQERITKEALALMVIHGECVSTAPSEEDVSVTHFEEAISPSSRERRTSSAGSPLARTSATSCRNRSCP